MLLTVKVDLFYPGKLAPEMVRCKQPLPWNRKKLSKVTINQHRYCSPWLCGSGKGRGKVN